MNGFQMNGRVVDPQKQSVIVELLLMKKTQARLQQKCVSPFYILKNTVKLGYNDHGYNEFTAIANKCKSTFLVSNGTFTT